MAACLAAAACGGHGGGQGANVLIGSWALDPGLSCDYDRVTFAAATITYHMLGDSFDGTAPHDDIVPVRNYTPDGPGKVIVVPVGQVTQGSYLIEDTDHINDGTPRCRFHRVG